MKKLFALVLTLAMVLTLTACSDQQTPDNTPDDSAANGEVLTIRLAHNSTTDENDTYHYMALAFTEKLEELSGGTMTTEIFPNGQYGGEREIFEATEFGTTDMSVMTNGNIGMFNAPNYAIDLPFMFADSETAWEALDGPAGQAILDSMEAVGVKGLAYGEVGFRHMVTNKHGIKTKADFSGLKIRSLENEMYVSTYTSLGANATPLAWTEVMSGLQQGTIDGLDIPLAIIYTQNFQDLADYLSLTGHFYNCQTMCMNLDFWNKLSAEQQAWVQEAADYSSDVQRAKLASTESQWIDELEGKGMTVIRADEIDFDSFKTSLNEIYDSYAKSIGGTYVQDMLDASAAAAK